MNMPTAHNDEGHYESEISRLEMLMEVHYESEIPRLEMLMEVTET